MAEKSESSPPLAVSYSWQMGFIYVFNLMLGAGILALPKAFAETGWVLGIISIGVLALIGYCTCTFVIEALAICNALLRHKSKEKKKQTDGLEGNVEMEVEMTDPNNVIVENLNICSSSDLVAPKNCEPEVGGQVEDDENYNLYDITVKLEFGDMAKLLFNKAGVVVYYLSICLYLYGDLAIYSAAISKSLTTVVCGDVSIFDTNKNHTAVCPNIKKISVMHMYRIMLAGFVLLICPFVFFNITRTKALQVFTTIFRWFALISMIVLALIEIAKGKGNHKPTLVNFSGLPQLFGVAVFAFMCQFSIPAVLTPVSNKNRINLVVILDFICVVSFYAMILFTAIFAFPEDKIQDVYALNFSSPKFYKYALELFPVFTLSANFPILAIVLRENLKTLILRKEEHHYGLFLRRILFPLVVIIPPIAIAYCTYDVGLLVGYTGGYAGAILQYVMPSMFVYCGRKYMVKMFGVYENKHRSPLQHRVWIFLVLLWYLIGLVFVTYNKVTGK